MKTQEELNAIKDELEALSEKLRELTPEEREQVTGGAMGPNVAGVIGTAFAAGTLMTQFS